jgi:cellular nucleic acid-binding protein
MGEQGVQSSPHSTYSAYKASGHYSRPYNSYLSGYTGRPQSAPSNTAYPNSNSNSGNNSFSDTNNYYFRSGKASSPSSPSPPSYYSLQRTVPYPSSYIDSHYYPNNSPMSGRYFNSESDQQQQQPEDTRRQGSGFRPKCFNCGDVGHMSAECSKPAMKMACYNCGENGHLSRECPKERTPKTCYRCNQVGHISSQCPNTANSSSTPQRSSSPSATVCYRCRQPGHYANQCPEEPKCYKCQQPGHFSNNCPQSQA